MCCGCRACYTWCSQIIPNVHYQLKAKSHSGQTRDRAGMNGARGRTSKTYSTLAVQKMRELRSGSVGGSESPGGRGSTLLRPVASIFVPVQARTELPLARCSVPIWDADTVPELLLSWVPKGPPRHRGEERTHVHT